MKNKNIDSFNISQKKTNPINNQKLVQWLNNIIEEKKLSLGLAEQETVGLDRKQPDIVIYDKPKSSNVICVIELKQPYHDVFDFYNLKEPAFRKAVSRKSRYFGCSNFKTLIIYKTEEVSKNSLEERQIIGKYKLSNLEDQNRIEDARIKNSIINNLTLFLTDLSQIISGEKEEPKIPVDELLIFRLQEKIKFLAPFYVQSIEEKIGGDKDFRQNVQKWFNDQSWNFSYDEENYKMLALQTAYSLVKKILFYNFLKTKYPQDLATMSIPADIPNGKMFKQYLQLFFDLVLDIYYEPIFATSFIDEIAFPNYRLVIESVLELASLLKRYDFSSIGYDIIGQIFEKLIPSLK